ncbi:TetR/AcrR family transcriptional regulator [Nocardia jejuensis]|uniref:TetR/AcrR family transcriptional regulator n=1 Tax=Nocardia jejuensis TaxID=328049 RepID=UPI0008356CD3|nr:TetR/AcrR family transcriptional regulator [Nocardia jejuensis]
MSLDPAVDRARLPRGTHGLDRTTVEKSQRFRLMRSALESVAERGYAPTTVADIVARAGVSRRTFYQFFTDRDDCFAAAYDEAVAYVIATLDAATASAPRTDWRTLVHTTLVEYLRVLTEHGEFARALHIEALAAGPRVARQRTVLKRVFADRMRAAFIIGRAAGDIPAEIDPEFFDALIGAIDDRIRDRLRLFESEPLMELAPQLYRFTLAVFGTPER